MTADCLRLSHNREIYGGPKRCWEDSFSDVPVPIAKWLKGVPDIHQTAFPSERAMCAIRDDLGDPRIPSHRANPQTTAPTQPGQCFDQLNSQDPGAGPTPFIDSMFTLSEMTFE